MVLIMTGNENYSEEVMLEIYSDIIESDYLYITASASSCGAPSKCGKYSNYCDSSCNCVC